MLPSNEEAPIIPINDRPRFLLQNTEIGSSNAQAVLLLASEEEPPAIQVHEQGSGRQGNAFASRNKVGPSNRL